MDLKLRADANAIITASIRAVQPDEAVSRALTGQDFPGRVVLVAAGKAAWQMAKAAYDCLGDRIDNGVVVTKYEHVMGPISNFVCCEAGHPVPDENSFAGTQKALDLVSDLKAEDTVLFLLSGGGSALFEKPLVPGPILQDVTGTCEQAIAIAKKYDLKLDEATWALLAQETPKALDNVTTQINGSVRELCRAAADAAQQMGYEPVILTDQLTCQAKEAGSLLASILKTHNGCGKKMAFIAGGETVVHLTGKGKGGRNQELALAAATGIAGIPGAAVFSVGSDGTDGPTDAAGGYTDYETNAALEALGLNVFDVLRNNDAYNALKAVDGLVITGPTGTNVNDVAVALLG